MVSSVVGAGISYFIWLAACLSFMELRNPLVDALGWLSAPVVTAAGFAIGILIFERLAETDKTGFFGIFIWPLIGCTIGAGAVYWFGPMLIVFGMFVAGTLTVVLREVFLKQK